MTTGAEGWLFPPVERADLHMTISLLELEGQSRGGSYKSPTSSLHPGTGWEVTGAFQISLALLQDRALQKFCFMLRVGGKDFLEPQALLNVESAPLLLVLPQSSLPPGLPWHL